MFHITLIDHVRLSFGSALAAYEGHADAAARLTRVSSYARMCLVSLAGAAAIVSAVAIGNGYIWQIAAAVLAAAVFAASGAYLAFSQQALIYGHRASASKLWVVCEKYRALLAEMHENVIDMATLQERRNALLEEAARVLEQSAPDDRYTYQIARDALAGARHSGYPDSFIDQYLPLPLRKGVPTTAAAAS